MLICETFGSRDSWEQMSAKWEAGILEGGSSFRSDSEKEDEKYYMHVYNKK